VKKVSKKDKRFILKLIGIKILIILVLFIPFIPNNEPRIQCVEEVGSPCILPPDFFSIFDMIIRSFQ